MRHFFLLATVSAFVLAAHAASSQTPPERQQMTLTRGPKVPIQKISDTVLQVGENRVNTKDLEVSVEGTINNVTVLEFVANTRGGLKAYESAVTLNTDAISFNTALLLLGLDPAHARLTTKHFDATAPEGDPVNIWVETLDATPKRFRAEQLIYDRSTNQTMPESNWVYTGSSFYNGIYSAQADGVLIGFVHSPSPIIENPRGMGLNRYGSVILNPNLGLAGGTPVRLTVKVVK